MTRSASPYVDLRGSIEMPRGHVLENRIVDAAIDSTNEMFVELDRVSSHISDLLGLRNLSALVGQAFARELEVMSEGLLKLNPHQDGYPDLLLMDSIGAIEFDNALPGSKNPFSPFLSGGIEVKATCGDVTSATDLNAIGKNKPQIGDTRIDLVTNVNWKSHHRETNYLIGIVWDFVDALPMIAAVTYSNSLIEEDWGKIVQPKEGGGRTTSVSIMRRSGISKMCRNTVRVLSGPYVDLIRKFARPSRR